MLCDVFVIIVRYFFIGYLILFEMISFKVINMLEFIDLLYNEKLLYCLLKIFIVIDIIYKMFFFIYNIMNKNIIYFNY